MAALRRRNPARIIVATPVASQYACEVLKAEVDEVVCLMTPEPFYAIGLWYEEFSQVTDDEVRALLQAGAAPAELASATPDVGEHPSPDRG